MAHVDGRVVHLPRSGEVNTAPGEGKQIREGRTGDTGGRDVEKGQLSDAGVFFKDEIVLDAESRLESLWGQSAP